MNWKGLITDDQLNNIADLIKKTESNSTAEIITVIANRSSTIRHIKLLIFLICSIVTFLCAQLINEYYFIEYLSFYVLFINFLLVPLSFLMAKSPLLQRIFISKYDQNFQVETMAEREFYVQRLHMTQAKTGLLIYVSILERKTILLTDEAISEKIPNDSWQQTINHITSGIHNENLHQGLTDGIESFKDRLTELFPANKDDNPNELPNHVILRELL